MVPRFVRLAMLLLLFASSPAAAARQEVMLQAFPLLSQRDPANYYDDSLMTATDTLPDGSGTAIVADLACAATVYTMLKRGLGNKDAMIDDSYVDPRLHGGDGPGAIRPSYVGPDVPIETATIEEELRAGRPVILHGYGGPLREHFVLVVGLRKIASGDWRLVGFDPWPGQGISGPGREIEIDPDARPVPHPLLSDVAFTKMRFVGGPRSRSAPGVAEAEPLLPSSPVAAEAETQAGGTHAVELNDGSRLVGTITPSKLPFKTSFGRAEVPAESIVEYTNGALLLSDGTSLKGAFDDAPASTSQLQLVTPVGVLQVPLLNIVSIQRGGGEPGDEVEAAEEKSPQAPMPDVLSTRSEGPFVGKSIRIASTGGYEPIHSLDDNGQLWGFDIDIANALCARMGARCEIVKKDWDQLIPGLLAGEYDAIAASMADTPERRQQVDFTDPYYIAPAKFLRRNGSGVQVSDTALIGRRVGVERGTIAAEFLRERFGSVVQIRECAQYVDCVRDMMEGRLDAVFGYTIALERVRANRDIGGATEFTGPDYRLPKWPGVGLVVRKGDAALREAFNAAVDDIVTDGSYGTIQSRYFAYDVSPESAAAPDVAEAMAPDLASCRASFNTILQGETACGLGLSSDGRLLDRGVPVSDPIVVSEYSTGETTTARRLVLFPASPSLRYQIIQACETGPEDDTGLCWTVLLYDRNLKKPTPTYAGKYGPRPWIIWSTDGTHALLFNSNDGVDWVHVLRMSDGVSMQYPGDNSDRLIDRDSVAWIDARRFKLRYVSCLESSCDRTAVASDGIWDEVAIGDSGLSAAATDQADMKPPRDGTDSLAAQECYRMVADSYERNADNPHLRTPQDWKEAAAWCREAADANHAWSQGALGWMYQSTMGGVPHDPVEAFRWFRKGAEGGDPSAQARLGGAYLTGFGTSNDTGEAIEWFRRAAEQRSALAQYTLGMLYETGVVGFWAPDQSEAVKWYQLAAGQGFPDAQQRLAELAHGASAETESQVDAAGSQPTAEPPGSGSLAAEANGLIGIWEDQEGHQLEFLEDGRYLTGDPRADGTYSVEEGKFLFLKQGIPGGREWRRCEFELRDDTIYFDNNLKTRGCPVPNGFSMRRVWP